MHRIELSSVAPSITFAHPEGFNTRHLRAAFSPDGAALLVTYSRPPARAHPAATSGERFGVVRFALGSDMAESAGEIVAEGDFEEALGVSGAVAAREIQGDTSRLCFLDSGERRYVDPPEGNPFLSSIRTSARCLAFTALHDERHRNRSEVYWVPGLRPLEIRESVYPRSVGGQAIRGYTRSAESDYHIALDWSDAPEPRLAVANGVEVHLLDTHFEDSLKRVLTLGSDSAYVSASLATGFQSYAEHRIAWISPEQALLLDAGGNVRRLEVAGRDRDNYRVGYPVRWPGAGLVAIQRFAREFVIGIDSKAVLLVVEPESLEGLASVGTGIDTCQHRWLGRVSISPVRPQVALFGPDDRIEFFDLGAQLATWSGPRGASGEVAQAVNEIGGRQLDRRGPMADFALLREHSNAVPQIEEVLAHAEDGHVRLTWEGWKQSRFRNEALSAAEHLRQVSRQCLEQYPPKVRFAFEDLRERFGLVPDHEMLLAAVARAIGLEYDNGIALPSDRDRRVALLNATDVDAFVDSLRPPAAAQGRNTVFISYGRPDRRYVNHFLKHLKSHQSDGTIEVWEDSKIKPGQRWREEINAALARTRIAILFVGENYMASDFIKNDELPPLLAAEKERGLVLMPVILDVCGFARHKTLSQFQTVNDPNEPVKEMEPAKRNRVWQKLVDDILDVLHATP